MLKIILPILGKWKLFKYILWGTFSGLLGFLIIQFITILLRMVISGELAKENKEYSLAFIAIVLFFIWIRRSLSLAIINLSQTIFWDFRKQIIHSILGADYERLLNRRTNIESAVVSDVQSLTDASTSIISFSTSLFIAIACLAYLAMISWPMFAITLVTAAVGVSVYHVSVQKNIRHFETVRTLEVSFIDNFNSILNGFKEIYLEPKKGESIVNRKINIIAQNAQFNNTQAFTGFINNQIIGQVLFYLLIASIMLYFSIILHVKPSDTVSFVFTLLYLLNSIETIMILLPSLMRASVAANHLVDLKKELIANEEILLVAEDLINNDVFSNLTIKDLSYHYGHDNKSFGIGPIDFKAAKGEVIFIYGGNGSGKTTFIHSLLGLLTIETGQISINGISVNTKNDVPYRTIFAVVFNDFYLFDELHGIERFDVDKWNTYLLLFELQGKVTIQDNCFSTTDLSTGQRKRLALVAALMEEKPVLVLDEWAADQDPYFRRKFYTEIIPFLKSNGITILAITHDDKYYRCADRLYKMDYGKLIEESISEHEPSIISK